VFTIDVAVLFSNDAVDAYCGDMSYAITDGENQLSFIDPLLTPFISMTGSVLSISQENIVPVSFSVMAIS